MLSPAFKGAAQKHLEPVNEGAYRKPKRESVPRFKKTFLFRFWQLFALLFLLCVIVWMWGFSKPCLLHLDFCMIMEALAPSSCTGSGTLFLQEVHVLG